MLKFRWPTAHVVTTYCICGPDLLCEWLTASRSLLYHRLSGSPAEMILDTCPRAHIHGQYPEGSPQAPSNLVCVHGVGLPYRLSSGPPALRLLLHCRPALFTAAAISHMWLLSP